MRLGAYTLIRQIGAGGMGEVWIAHRPGPDGRRRPVAIKRLPRRLAGDPSYRSILLEEARLSQLLSHPNIVHTIDSGEAEGEVFIAMELIDGLDLSRINKILTARGERLPVSIAAYIVAEVLRGLDYAHNLEHEGELISLVHRDVSPHNVMLSTSGAVKLTDFGVARLSSEDTSGTHVKGKARYMPPEQLRGDSRSPTVDLFATGAVFQELLDGCLFRGAAVDDARLLGMAIDGVVPALVHPEDVPRELDRLRRSLLATDPEQRPRSASRALDRLHRWSGYSDRTREVAELVTRLSEHEAEFAGSASQTGLAHQATFLHTNDLELDLSDADELAEFVDAVEAPDRILLELATNSEEGVARYTAHESGPEPPANEHTDGTLGWGGELDRTHGSGSAMATGGHPSPSREPSLALDPGESFARHVPTGPNPTVAPPRGAKRLVVGLVVGLGLLATLGGGGWFTALELGWLPLATDEPIPAPTTALRRAKVVSRGSMLDYGLRDPKLDALIADQILFHFDVDPYADPLGALARDEAEFALTNLDSLVGASDPPNGKIVAILGLPLASEALVLDTAEKPKLRELDDLLELDRSEFDGKETLAYTHASEPLASALETTLAALGPSPNKLEFVDDAAVFNELQRDGSSIVAGLLHEPWISKARAAGMTVAASGLDLPLAHVEVLVASTRVLADDPELVEAVVATYYAGIVDLREQQAARAPLIDRVAAAWGLTRAEAEQALTGLCMFDARGAEPWFTGTSDSPLAAALDATTVPGQVPAIASVIDPRFILAAAQAQESATRADLDACLDATPARLRQPQALGPLAHPDPDAALFEFGRATIDKRSLATVTELGSALQNYNAATISVDVVGFGDRPGTTGRKLGRARAEQIIETLRAAGVTLPLTATGKDQRGAPTSRLQILLTRAY